MKDPLISVIIPVYNTEKYLCRCLNSVVKQTYQNLEIICIDDGSSDNSGKILEQYALNDNRVKVFHQKNQGTSAARNKGLDIASGDYIAFVDSDDYIVEDMYAKMLHTLLENEVNICVCQWQYETADGQRVVEKRKIDPLIYGRKSTLEFSHFLYRGAYENGTVATSCNKLYNKSIFSELRFTDTVAEDEALNDQVNTMDLNVYVMDEFLYIYVCNENSFTHKSFSVKSFSFLDTLEKRRCLFKDDGYICEETERLYCNLYIEYNLKASENGLNVPSPEKYRHTFKRMFQALYRETKTDMRFRLRMILFYHLPSLYKLLTRK